jgi:hypothetical protein
MIFEKCPEIIVIERKTVCKCDCAVDFLDACSACPKGRWGKFFCDDTVMAPPENISEKIENPSFAEMVKSATKSAAIWANHGFQYTDEKTLKERMEICSKCEFWNSESLMGSGRCMKCGCSTWAKLRMATEKCPIGKW